MKKELFVFSLQSLSTTTRINLGAQVLVRSGLNQALSLLILRKGTLVLLITGKGH